MVLGTSELCLNYSFRKYNKNNEFPNPATEYPASVYLFKAAIETLEQRVRSFQS